MNILVTGGAGYVGSVVVETLVARGHKTGVYDNLYKGHRDSAVPEAIFIKRNWPIARRWKTRSKSTKSMP